MGASLMFRRAFDDYIAVYRLLMGMSIAALNLFASHGRVLVTAQQIRDLAVDDAKRAYPVKLNVIATYVDPGMGELFVQDKTNGVFVFIRQSRSDKPVNAGDRLLISGVTTPGDFAPAVTDATIHVLGPGPLPRPRRLPFEEYGEGRHECQRAEIEGVVRSGEIKQGRLLMHVAAPGGSFVAILIDYPPEWVRTLIDSEVVLTGVVAAIFNDRRQAVGLRMFIPGRQIRIVDAAPKDPFTLPLSSIGSVGAIHPGETMVRWIRVRGAVTAVQPRGGVYLSDGSQNIEVLAASGCGETPGARVDVVGFPSSVEGRPGIEDAICRSAGRSAEISPAPVSAADVIPSLMRDDPSGYGFSSGRRYDMATVRMEGTLLQSSHGSDATTLVLNSGKQQFLAVLPGAGGQDIQLREGSRLQITGVCLVTYDQFRRAQSFRVLLRTPADVAVIARAPWWNSQHAAWVIAIVLASLLVTVTWVSVLRKQVLRQTQQLRIANEALLELSQRDGLTGAANRRKFDEALESEFTRAGRSSSWLALLLVDIDHFKALNDDYGHQRGDECLIQVVGALQSVLVRNTDVVARYGGEEFAVILPDTNFEGASAAAGRVQGAIRTLAIPHSRSPFDSLLSVSVGVAVAKPHAGSSIASLIAAADKALYRSKMAGRNRISFLEVTDSTEAAFSREIRCATDPVHS